ncbi:MAG TPA: hypothetical protein VMI10_22105 [Terriglobales bacterium]|nr:hypothetical protein [Terriglobales bacterium]
MPSNALDWAVIGLVLFIAGGIILAFTLYLRTAYCKGGWRQVKTSFILAIVALVALYLVRTAENFDVRTFKDIVNHKR